MLMGAAVIRVGLCMGCLPDARGFVMPGVYLKPEVCLKPGVCLMPEVCLKPGGS